MTRGAAWEDGRRVIGLVTSELPTVGVSGGIGAAIHELAHCLVEGGSQVIIFYAPGALPPEESLQACRTFLEISGIELQVIDWSVYSYSNSPESRSFAVYKHLTRPRATVLDVVHFHDFQGLGFYYLQAVRLGTVSNPATSIVQLHGPTRWTLECNGALFSTADQVKKDWMEWRSLQLADHLVAPSQYMAHYVEDRLSGSEGPRVHVIKNVFRSVSSVSVAPQQQSVDEIIFFGRHEQRKGLDKFCDALDFLAEDLYSLGITVTLLGNFGMVNDDHSGIYLVERGSRWKFPFRILPGIPRDRAMRYLQSASSAIVVIPSPEENSPYTVIEAIGSGRPVLLSKFGGASELLAEDIREPCTFEPEGSGIADAIARVIRDGPILPRFDQSGKSVCDDWLRFHEEILLGRDERAEEDVRAPQMPLVSVIVTHFERPSKLLDAVDSILRQTYPNVELVLVDDGSTSPQSIKALDKLEMLIARMGGQVVRRDNGYLGAARNSGLQAATGELIIFLDDDDVALPNLVERLVEAHGRCPSDVIVPLNTFMHAASRAVTREWSELSDQRVSYLPLGGPISLAPTMNLFGAATALFPRRVLEDVGGYTELVGVGHEDFELYARLALVGVSISVLPEVLYLYEVDAPSMIGRTSQMRNYARVVEAVIQDPKASMACMADALRLVSGQVALEHAENRKLYEYSLDPAADDLRALHKQHLSVDESLEALSRIAAGRGHTTLARDLDLSKELRSRLINAGGAEEVDTGSRRTRYLALSAQGRDARSTPSDIALVVLDLESTTLGPESGHQVRLALESDIPLNPGTIQWLFRIPWLELQAKCPDEFAGIVEVARTSLHDFLQSGSGEEAEVGATALHAWLGDAVGLGNQNSLRLLIALDSEEYLDSHEDVRGAVESGFLESALEHYLASGVHENREGFALSRLYADLSGYAKDPSGVQELLQPFLDESVGAKRLMRRLRRSRRSWAE